MEGVLTGFSIIAVIIGVGYLVGRFGLLGEQGPRAISRLVFSVLSPCLLLTVLADADVHTLFSETLAVSAIASALCILVYAVIAVLALRRSLPEVVVGSATVGYVNANNVGIPVAAYVLGDPAYSAPVILFQVLVLTPIVLTLLDLGTGAKVSLRRQLMRPLTNPMIIGAALGVVLSITDFRLPDPVMEPLRIIGAAAVPLVLIGFGASLSGQRVLEAGSGRRDVLLASMLKLALMPFAAWGVGLLFQLDAELLRVVVVLAALPTAQNVHLFAQRYQRGEILARDTVLITTVISLPLLLVVSLLLA